jgi:AGZA family xanthine/uracil permease-like MFS transporter
MVLAAEKAKDLRVRVSMILGAALITGILGFLGLPQLIVDQVGPEIFAAMLCGVGLFLTKVAFWNLTWKMNKLIGFTTIIVAVGILLLTNNLILAIAISVPLGALIKWILVRTGKATYDDVKFPVYKNWLEAMKAEFRLVKPIFNWKVVWGSLSLSTLTIGAGVAYTAINLSMAPGATATYNQVTVISSIADFFSSLFGGPSMEVVISGTAAAPNPVLSGALLMFGSAAIILTGRFAYEIAKYIPVSGMAGYLAAIGAVLVAWPNGQFAFQTGNPAVILATVGVTLWKNPFWGLLTGIVVKTLMGFLGIV